MRKWIRGVLVSVVLFSVIFYCGATALAFDSYSLRRNSLWPPGEDRLFVLAIAIILGVFFGVFAVGMIEVIKESLQRRKE